MQALPSRRRAVRGRRDLIQPALIAALALVACAGNAPARLEGGVQAKQPGVANRGQVVRLMTLNLAHGRGTAFHQALLGTETIEHNLAAVAAVVRREAPDVVALQEADGPSVWSGDFDHVALLAHDAGMSHHFRGTQTHGFWPVRLDYGTSLLARFPLLSPRSQAFDASWRDTKGFVVATVSVPALGGMQVDVISVHLDFLSQEVRARQIAELEKALAGRERPVIVLGDMNCGLAERTCVPALMSDEGLTAWSGGAATFPSDDPERRIDWVLVSKPLVFESYRTLSDLVSDHRGVIAEIGLAPASSSRTAATPTAQPEAVAGLPPAAAAQPREAKSPSLANSSTSASSR